MEQYCPTANEEVRRRELAVRMGACEVRGQKGIFYTLWRHESEKYAEEKILKEGAVASAPPKKPPRHGSLSHITGNRTFRAGRSCNFILKFWEFYIDVNFLRGGGNASAAPSPRLTTMLI